MNLDNVTIRPVEPAELDDVAEMRAVGFGGRKEHILVRLKNDPRYKNAELVVAEFDGQLVGTASVFPAQMWLSGVPLSVGAVAGVTVLPSYKRKGIAGKLMETLITKMHADGLALSVLFPFSHRYYNNFGYGTISDLHAYAIAPENIAVTGDASQVRPFSPDDLPMMRVVYKGQMTWHNGWFTRSNAWWDNIVERWQNIVVFETDGFIDGYLIFLNKNGPKGEKILHIREFFAAEPEAYQALLAYLAQQKVEVIEYLAPADTPLRYSLAEPIAVNAENRHWIFNDLCHITPGPMGRIINLSEALTTRFYTRGMSGERVLKVRDPQVPANEAPIVFRLVDGRAETRPAGDAAPQIETDISTLTQVMCGYLTSADARRLGRFNTDADTASWLDKITADAPLYIQAGDWF
jgi:predicted acetyltransferase